MVSVFSQRLSGNDEGHWVHPKMCGTGRPVGRRPKGLPVVDTYTHSHGQTRLLAFGDQRAGLPVPP